MFTRFKSAESQSDQLCYSRIYLFDNCDGSTPCQVDFLWVFFCFFLLNGKDSVKVL